jgi:hypothetical protein
MRWLKVGIINVINIRKYPSKSRGTIARNNDKR